jgi:hypothetical protein
MAAAKSAPTEVIDEKMRAKFREITKKPYIDQGKWYLNGFWAHGNTHSFIHHPPSV